MADESEAWWRAEGLSVLAYVPIDVARHPSPQPTPEELLVGLEERESVVVRWTEEERRELRLVLDIADPLDVELLYLTDVAHVPQTEVGPRLDMAQPSVSSRRTVFLAWLSRVVPARLALREALRGEELPTGLSELDAGVFENLVWQHRTQTFTADRLGVSQGRVLYRYRRMLRTLPRPIVERMPASTIAWHPPADHRALHHTRTRTRR